MKVHRHLDEELERLRDTVLRLGGESEAALRRAMHSLSERDRVAAHEVLAHDDVVDELEVEVDRQCIDIFVLRQPAARDLRFVMSVTKIAPLLERIADHACNIARTAIDLADEPEFKNGPRIAQMGEIASSMLAEALDAFTKSDAAAAREIILRDAEINNLYNEIFSELIGMMVTSPNTATRSARLLLVAKHLERIGDYVTDISELTVYMAEAAIIKHQRDKLETA
ncbi:MAG TPA: phosphate signaling complex protein PhoU [Pyrinomonadaceae bacterium]|nr:phosphate signaling complex protein PhoU [Pyrinomonadaceae bacterium]